MKYFYRYKTPLGDVTLAGDGENLTDLWFERQKYASANLGDGYEERKLPVFCRTMEWLDVYFKGKEPSFMPSLKLSGTPFRMKVWERLRHIPYGETVTYGQIAKEIAVAEGIAKMSAQAVGGAIGHNPIGILVPCHRVLGADKSLTGYAAGIERKKALLDLEAQGIACDHFLEDGDLS